MTHRVWDGSCPEIVHPNAELRRRQRLNARRAAGFLTIGDLAPEPVRAVGVYAGSLVVMTALEASAVSAGEINPTYVVMRLLRLRALREFLERIPGTHHGYRKAISTLVFTDAERDLLDRCVNEAFSPAVRAAIRRQETFTSIIGADVLGWSDLVFDFQVRKESKNRADYRQLDCCDGSGWDTLQMHTGGVKGGGEDETVARRVRCETCQLREREARLVREESIHRSKLLISVFAGILGVTPTQLLKSRGSRRFAVNAGIAALAKSVPRDVLLEVTGWKPPTLTKAIQDAIKFLPGLGNQGSATTSLPSLDGRGSAHVGVVDGDSSSSLAAPSLPQPDREEIGLSEAQYEELNAKLDAILSHIGETAQGVAERFPDDEISTAVELLIVSALGKEDL